MPVLNLSRIARIFLALVGAAYLVLAVWCSVDVNGTSRAVGFRLEAGSGESEFLTVYGGLEFALAVIFLSPLIWRNRTIFVLWVCVVIHGSLVLFRSAGFLLFSDIRPGTFVLSGVEWFIFLTSLSIWLFARSPPRDASEKSDT